MTYNFDSPTTPKYDFGTPQVTPGNSKAVPTTLQGNPQNLFGLPSVAGAGADTGLGVAYNTVVGLPQAGAKFVKEGAQGFARDLFGVGLSLGNAINTVLGRDTNTSYTPSNSVSKAILGEKTDDLATRVVDTEQAIKDSPTAKKYGLDKYAGPLAFGGVIGSVGLDFLGAGGEEAVGKQLLKETTEEGALNLLTKSKVPIEVAKEFAPRFAAATKPAEITGLMDLMKGAVGANNLATEATARTAAEAPSALSNNKFVKDEPFNPFLGTTDRKTAQGLRDEFVGIKNEQIIRGNQLADTIKKAVPDLADRQGMFWYKAAEGDTSVLEAALKDPSLEKYHPQIEKALNLPEEAKKAVETVGKFYQEAGQVALKNDSIKGITENYQNRIYEQTPPKDYVKTELPQGLKQTTSHGKERIFSSEFEAAQAGKKFATTDIADALSIYNEEMARVNTSMKLFDSMEKSGIGTWTDRPAAGWSPVGNLRKGTKAFVAPNGIAKGLSAIADPNYLSKIDALRGLQKYQGLVKSVDLSFSFFHHLTFAVQTLSQGGITALLKSPVMGKILKSPEFAEMELDFVKNTGITTKVSANQDIVRQLLNPESKEGLYNKATQAPVIKQVLSASQKMGSILFDDIQRYLKVSDFGSKVANWVASHPTATNVEVTAAKRGFAKEVNAAYGGLNWESMGVTKSELAGLRLLLLAPDYTFANASMVKYAFQTGTVGSAARKNLVVGTASMIALTEGLNKIMTGHFTDKNPTGHKLELEIAPGVYISLLRGAQGELNKLVSNIITNGPIKGTAQYAQGKLAPVARTAVGIASGVNYYGGQISPKGSGPVKSTVDYAKYIGQNAGPVPFSFSNTAAYFGSKRATPAGVAAMSTGIGRYAPGALKKAKYSF